MKNYTREYFYILVTDQAIPEQTHTSSKRKRDDQSIQKSLNSSMKSMSQLSISQAAVPKKTKHSHSRNNVFE